MAQQFADAFHVHPPLHTPRGVAVPQAMEIPIPHTAALQQHLIAVLHRPRVRDDLPAGQQVAVRLLCLWLQHPQHLFRNGYPAFGIFRFRWLHRQARPAAYLRDALHRRQQRRQVLDVGGIGADGVEQRLTLIAVALIYLAMVMIFTKLVSLLERRLRNSDH